MRLKFLRLWDFCIFKPNYTINPTVEGYKFTALMCCWRVQKIGVVGEKKMKKNTLVSVDQRFLSINGFWKSGSPSRASRLIFLKKYNYY